MNTKLGLYAIAFIATAALSACNSGSGSNAPTTGVVGVSNASGYVGSATYVGSLGVVPAQVQLYRQFLNLNRVCAGYQCSSSLPYLQMQVSTGLSGGYLPGPVSFTITPALATGGMQPITGQGSGFLNTGNNGFVVNYYGPYYSPYYGQQPNINPMFQISTSYNNIGVAVALVYQGTTIAVGNLTGTMQQQSWWSP